MSLEEIKDALETLTENVTELSNRKTEVIDELEELLKELKEDEGIEPEPSFDEHDIEIIAQEIYRLVRYPVNGDSTRVTAISWTNLLEPNKKFPELKGKFIAKVKSLIGAA